MKNDVAVACATQPIDQLLQRLGIKQPKRKFRRLRLFSFQSFTGV